MPETPPAALLFLSSQCPHCPAVLSGLADLVKRGLIGRLEAVNIQAHPEAAREQGVRAVPWVWLGPFRLTGAQSPGELETWARRAAAPEGLADAFHDYLRIGAAAEVLHLVEEVPERLAGLLPIVANPEASLNVRLGAGMVFEEYAGKPALQGLVPELCRLAESKDARVRADVAHLLGLVTSSDAEACLKRLLADDDADVREIAVESLAPKNG